VEAAGLSEGEETARFWRNLRGIGRTEIDLRSPEEAREPKD